MARVMDTAGAAATDDRVIHKVPNPFPLTLAGMLAALGPQAINFGISIGGGEAYLLPNVAARGTLHMHWLMLISVVLETALVYECIKYSVLHRPLVLRGHQRAQARAASGPGSGRWSPS